MEAVLLMLSSMLEYVTFVCAFILCSIVVLKHQQRFTTCYGKELS